MGLLIIGKIGARVRSRGTEGSGVFCRRSPGISNSTGGRGKRSDRPDQWLAGTGDSLSRATLGVGLALPGKSLVPSSNGKGRVGRGIKWKGQKGECVPGGTNRFFSRVPLVRAAFFFCFIYFLGGGSSFPSEWGMSGCRLIVTKGWCSALFRSREVGKL